MIRRKFLKNGVLAISASSLLGTKGFTQPNQNENSDPFSMDFAPHPNMFQHSAGSSLIDQIKFMADKGFRSFEDNDMAKRSIDDQKILGQLLNSLKMRMGVFVAHKIYWNEPTLTSGKKEFIDEFLASIKSSVEVAKRCGARWMTVVPGHLDLGKEMGHQTSNVISILRRACEILEPHNLVMVLEPLNFRDHPGMFLSKSSQAYEICKAVNSPSCKILFDIYHQQITEGNLIPNIDSYWDEIAYFQIGDNPGRKEPTTGEINYLNVFKHIQNKGYKGILGMEHGNSIPNQEGEKLVIKAYRNVSQFS
ncbi:hydroxypyruvate isomerase family protein [Aegicerativicinus sediminis]|uniref:hydroxypyruvate isomerase family protein n=1 Tax=Aegicerativicinus sediminis TaxID=2893202 RepID=UPI001E3BC486|nr:TIM barrel protein [Aegicerativicinus sediminis]